MNFIINDLRILVRDMQKDLDSIKEYLGKLEDLIQPENSQAGKMILVEDAADPYAWCSHGFINGCAKCRKT